MSATSVKRHWVSRVIKRNAMASVIVAVSVWTAGCETGGQTGALAGGGIGALVGQAAGGDTEATLIGAGIGAGIGYLIGNEEDKKQAREMSARSAPPTYAHSDTGSLGGTSWKLVSLVPRDVVPEFVSKTVEFRVDGRALTTTTKPDGDVEVYDESYRVVNDTLIVNKPGYIINARYQVSGNQLVVNAEDFSAVLERLR
ncbi:MAG: glycine zipper domain-containing protein [Planctomycetota bacterium]